MSSSDAGRVDGVVRRGVDRRRVPGREARSPTRCRTRRGTGGSCGPRPFHRVGRRRPRDEAVGVFPPRPLRLLALAAHVAHGSFDAVAVHVVEGHGDGSMPSSSSAGMSLNMYCAGILKSSLGLRVSQFWGEELVHLAAVLAREPDHRVDDPDVGRHRHGAKNRTDSSFRPHPSAAMRPAEAGAVVSSSMPDSLVAATARRRTAGQRASPRRATGRRRSTSDGRSRDRSPRCRSPSR